MMNQLSEAEVFILEVVASGSTIRKLDGRWEGGFVDVDALGSLLDKKKVEAFNNHGLTFVRKLTKHADRRHRRRR